MIKGVAVEYDVEMRLEIQKKNEKNIISITTLIKKKEKFCFISANLFLP